MSTCAVVRSFIESKTTEVQTSNVGFTSEVSDYLVVHTGPEQAMSPGLTDYSDDTKVLLWRSAGLKASLENIRNITET